MGDKHYRLIIFVVNICPIPLRKTFQKYMNADTAHPNNTLDNYLQARRKELLMKKSKKILRQDQWDLLFPKSGSADESSWDLTLIILLIDTLFSKQLQPIEKNAINDIRTIRNDLIHKGGDTSMSDVDFNNLWTKLAKAAVSLAQQILQVPHYVIEIQERIDDAKINNMPDLGDALRAHYQSIILELNSKIEDMDERLRSLTMTTEDNLSCSKESHAILKDLSVQKPGPSGEKVSFTALCFSLQM